jgi:C1A family cysteine protease
LALPVCDQSRGDFWNGEGNLGGHAVTAVGFNDLGFLIKNSWGYEWNDGGYTILPYNEFDKVIEAWCVIC